MTGGDQPPGNDGGSTTPPVRTTTLSLASGAVVAAAVPVTAIVPDGTSTVEFRVDGAVVSTIAAAPFITTWNTYSAANGAHTLAANAISNVVETKMGYELIKVWEKKPERQRPIEEVAENIKNSLLARERNDKRRDILRQLKEGAKIEQLLTFDTGAPGQPPMAAPGMPGMPPPGMTGGPGMPPGMAGGPGMPPGMPGRPMPPGGMGGMRPGMPGQPGMPPPNAPAPGGAPQAPPVGAGTPANGSPQ